MKRLLIALALTVMLGRAAGAQQPENVKQDSIKSAQQDTTRKATTKPRESMDKKEVAAPRVDNIPLNPDAKGFITLPGTGGAEVRLGGYARLDMIRDLDPAGATDLFVPSTIPIGGGPDTKNFNLHVRQTRMSFELRRPSAMGRMRAYLEFDLYGPGTSTALHLRHAYVQAANLLVGQTYSPFMDIDAFPNTVDFEGPNSASYITVPMIQYTRAINDKWTFQVALAQPSSDVTLPSAGAVPVSPLPDLAFHPRYEADWGHAQLGVVLRDIGYDDGNTQKRTFGFGLQGTAVIGLGKNTRDVIQLDGLYGQGIGRYINDLVGFGLDAAQDGAGDITALPAFGGYVGFQHFWNDKWSSQVVAGILQVDNSAGQGPTAFHQTQYYSVNAVWSPTSVFSLGLEVLYGDNEQNDGQSDHATRLQAGFQFYFYDGS
ncbi:MAG TPA: DcaP family trimeric outer membrane transporter [Gemmatimonadales bacterium]|nr:DcaP family trimeric outer membrane transporter [Gemmatimonadales bacterium]